MFSVPQYPYERNYYSHKGQIIRRRPSNNPSTLDPSVINQARRYLIDNHMLPTTPSTPTYYFSKADTRSGIVPFSSMIKAEPYQNSTNSYLFPGSVKPSVGCFRIFVLYRPNSVINVYSYSTSGSIDYREIVVTVPSEDYLPILCFVTSSDPITFYDDNDLSQFYIPYPNVVNNSGSITIPSVSYNYFSFPSSLFKLT